MPAKISIYQIFYDEVSKMSLDGGFIPLDNSQSKYSDWYEFWPIQNFLLSTRLDEETWYGFLSPKFNLKTGLNSQFVRKILNDYDQNANVALFTHGWDQLAYFQNPFEQGDVWHPGLKNLSQEIFNEIDIKIDLDTLVTHSMTSVFSNYIIAKPIFWNKWLEAGNKLFSFIESGKIKGSNALTSYGSTSNLAPIKTFIQERLASVILSTCKFSVISPDFSQSAPIFSVIFNDEPSTRRLLQACDLLKESYCNTSEQDYLNMYKKLKSKIFFKNPYS